MFCLKMHFLGMLHWKLCLHLFATLLCFTTADGQTSESEDLINGELNLRKIEKYESLRLGRLENSTCNTEPNLVIFKPEDMDVRNENMDATFEYGNYNGSKNVVLTNTGRGLKVSVHNDSLPWVRQGFLDKLRKIYLDVIFISTETGGITPNQVMELQLIHSGPDGLEAVVLSRAIEECTLYEKSPWIMGVVTNALKEIREPNSSVKIENFKLMDLIDHEEMWGISYLCNAFQYNGTLARPACTEGVTWLVFDKPMCLFPAQYGKFTEILQDSEGNPIARKSRPNHRRGNNEVKLNVCRDVSSSSSTKNAHRL